MAETKRTYNIPLRREFQKAPMYRRTKKAMTALKEFVAKHMKTEDIVVFQEVNELLWKNGIQNPPHHVKVDILKTEEGKVYVQLEGLEIKVEKSEDKKESKKKESSEAEEKPAKKSKPKAEEKAEKTE
jgi:large subunit ribosomal protein L31e